MPQITKLKSQKNKKIVNVFLDGKFSLGLSLDEIVKKGLTVGQVLTNSQVEQLFFASLFEKVYFRVLNFLSFRPRSKKEVVDYLDKKLPPDFSCKIKLKILKKLKEQKLLDERQFALWWLDQRLTFNPKGKKLLSLELRQKGIDQETINEVIAEIDEAQLEKQAKKILEKKIKLWQNLPPKEQKHKLMNQLLRRGFDWQLTKKVIDEFMQK